VLVQAARSDTKLEARQHPRRRSRWSRRHQPKPLCHLPLAALARRRPVWPDAPRGRAASRRAPTCGRKPCHAAAATAGDRRRHTSRAAAADRAFAGPGARVRKPPTMTPPRVASFLQPANLSTLLPPPPPRARGPGQSPLRPHRRRREGEATRSASISGHLRRHASYTTHRSMIPCRPARRCLRELASDPKFPTAAQGASRQGAE
jgi:hypothetical protein